MLHRFWEYNKDVLSKMSYIAATVCTPVVLAACAIAFVLAGAGAALKIFAIGAFFLFSLVSIMAGLLLMDHVRRM